jgi:acyl-CoA thioesterase
MSDLHADIDLRDLGDNGFEVTLSRAWEIWGPNGGYMAAIALRAAQVVSGRTRPANATVHFLAVASFDEPVRVRTEVLRASRHATSVLVRIEQDARPILAALVWALDPVPGLDHHDAVAPDVPSWSQLPTLAERMAADPDALPSRFAFWSNFEQRPVSWLTAAEWANRELAPAEYLNWLRFLGGPPGDPWRCAERLLLLVDLGGWPAIGRRHRTDDWMAPSIDVSCEFHHLDPEVEWLLLDARSEVGSDGLLASEQHVWADDGRLMASGISHLLCRQISVR